MSDGVSSSQFSIPSLDREFERVQRSHCERVTDAIALIGAKADASGLWIRFWTKDEPSSLGTPQYLNAKHQWRVLLNPNRSHFYDVVRRSALAMRTARLPIDGVVVGKDIARKSKWRILDDPCEPKLMFCCTGRNQEESRALFTRTIRRLEQEFPAKEQKSLACSQGIRYRDDVGANVAQWGPSFTKMKTPLIFYQQGGFVESERARIVQEELERFRFGLENRSAAHQRIYARLSRFFEGDQFYRYVGSKDPLAASEATIPRAIQARSERAAAFTCTRNQITWISGSTSASLPPIFHSRTDALPALIPTGQLLQMGIPPMCGTLGLGILPNGLNMSSLSGVEGSNAAIALEYAHRTLPFNREKETSVLRDLPQIPMAAMARCKIAAMRLAQMGLSSTERRVLGENLRALIASLSPLDRPREGWERFLPLVGQTAPQCFLKPNLEVEPGTIVGVPAEDETMVFGKVLPSFNNDIHVQRSEKKEDSVYCSDWMVFPVPDGIDGSSFVGQPFPEELMEKEPSLQPGTFFVFPDLWERGSYAMVLAAREDFVELLSGSGQVLDLPRLRTRRLVAPPVEHLEQALRSNPVLMDVEFAASKVLPLMQGRREAAEEILRIIESEPSVVWNEQERTFIEEPFSVVFGSMTAQPMIFRNGFPNEYFLNGPQEMGRDIQLIFVPEKRIREVQEYASSHMPEAFAVGVHPIEMLDRD